MNENPNRRILLIDDTPSIHEDFRKILGVEESGSDSLEAAKLAFFGDDEPAHSTARITFEIDSASQGQEGLEMLRCAVAESRPYALAFVDMRMPPGWDGLRTIAELWRVDSDLQVVICTAYSDYSWDQTIERLGQSDRLLILKKPFDSVEITQMASALTEKWNLGRRERRLIEGLRSAEQEARSYASSLETVNRALITSKAAAERSSEAKTEFLLHLSNEIHENVRTILAEVSELRAPQELSPEEIARLEAILTAGSRLALTFNEILDLTLIESGRMRIESAELDVVGVVRSIEAAVRPRARAKAIETRVEFLGPVPARIRTDERRFRQVLAQIVENAVEYTNRGSVRVQVSLEHTDDWQTSRLRCDVIDTGPGIEPEHHGRLFEPFYRAGRPPTARPGPGLGLAICKRLAKALGGDVQVETCPGRGSTFQFTCDAGSLQGVHLLEPGALPAG